MSREALRVVVAGYIVRGPLGGMAWHGLQYVLGLHRLGHDVLFIEDSDDYESCWDPERNQLSADPSFGLRFADRAFKRLDLADRWAYHDAHTGTWHGPTGEQARQLCAEADVLLNVSGVNPIRPWLAEIEHRVLIDTDPVFTQVRHLSDAEARRAAEAHTAFFSFGENFGRPGCTIPPDGFDWQPTRQPIVLDAWRATPGPRGAPFTTVMQWEAYPAIEHDGVRYGLKTDSFAPYEDLPSRTTQILELALGSAGAPRERLRERGWRVRNPEPPTRDPWIYQHYLRESKGEWSVAKHAYATTHSGWFSERSAGYLASGRPVVVEDTGFTDWLDADAGVVGFATPDEAVAALADVDDRYDEHCRAARELCELYFDSAAVLDSLFERL